MGHFAKSKLKFKLFALVWIVLAFYQPEAHSAERCTVDDIKKQVETFDLVANDDYYSQSHTVSRHINKSDKWLNDYLFSHPKIKGISTYDNLETAKEITKAALFANINKIYTWLCIGHQQKTDNDNKYRVATQKPSSQYQKYPDKYGRTLRLSYQPEIKAKIGHGLLRQPVPLKNQINNETQTTNLLTANQNEVENQAINQQINNENFLTEASKKAQYYPYQTNKVVLILRKSYDSFDTKQKIIVKQPKVENNLGVKKLIENIFSDKNKPKQNIQKQNVSQISTAEPNNTQTQSATIGATNKDLSESQTVQKVTEIESDNQNSRQQKHIENNENNPKFFLLTSYPVPTN